MRAGRARRPAADGRPSAAVPPGLHQAARAGARGALGRLQYIYSNRLNLGKVRREEDILWSFAPHDLSMILSLVGAGARRGDARRAATTCTRRSPTSRRRTSPSRAASRRTFSCPGCTRSRSRSSSSSATGRWRCSTTGSRGSRKLLLYPHRIEWRETACRCRARRRPSRLPLDAGEPLNLECRHFLDCIATGSTPRTDGREGLRGAAGARRGPSDALKQDCSGEPGAGATGAARSGRAAPRIGLRRRAVRDRRGHPDLAFQSTSCRAPASAGTARSARTSWSART